MDNFIDAQVAAYPQLAAEFEELRILATKKLWHQLSVSLEAFLVSNKSRGWNVNTLNLYEQFVCHFESRLSPVRLAIIISLIGHGFIDLSFACDFYNKILAQSKGKLGDEASMCITMDIALTKLRLGQLDEVKAILEDAKDKLLKSTSSESIVFSKFYLASAEYRKVAGPPQEFYKAALMYLAYTSIDELEPQQRYELATDLTLAAATGEGIYNFGEIITNPILLALKDSPNNWLYDLINVLNAGDIDGFNALVDRQRAAYFAQPALASMHEDVKKKIVFMCLMNIVFERHSHDRTISYAVIAERTRLPCQEVEWVLMRALSLGLIKGSMDEVDGTIDVTWVQPRVLDGQQLQLLQSQFEVWAAKVKDAVVIVEDQTPELYV